MKLFKSVLLIESINHIEDLSSSEFISAVENLKNNITTEKLDGAELQFGLDEKGVFTSREGKSPKKPRFYKVSDYAMVSNYNGFRAAHLAIEQISPEIKKYFKIGDQAEIEVLFGRQPNTVTYGVENKNFIVILRGVNGTTQETVDALSKAIDGKKVNVKSTIISSPDGSNIENTDENMTWEFTNVKPLNTSKIDLTDTLLLINKMKEYLADTNKNLPEFTNQEIEDLSLNKVPKEEREKAKTERERVKSILLNSFKTPIKDLLLGKFVRNIKPFLQDSNLHPAEDIGVEGVVVRDPKTGEQIKIVDKDVFTAINTFNNSVRSSIAGLVRTTDQEAPIELRGGSLGQAKIRIANLLGAKELALSSGAKRFITKFKSSSVQSTAIELAQSLNIRNVEGIKIKIVAILRNSISEIDSILNDFKMNSDKFILKLKTGKELGISPEVMKRTLTAFAETKKDIMSIISNVKNSTDSAGLVLALYGKTIESVFDGESKMQESYNLIKSISEDDAVSNTTTTTAGDIAPVEKKMFGSKPILSRVRNPIYSKISKFKKFKFESRKFSLMKHINENWAHVGDMKFATNVDDTVNARNDVEFNKLRNNVSIGTDVTQMDVNRYLDKAHELNDEVDSIIFGMEMDDGSIAKIYVNTSDADAFEQALSELLGKEDDIETVVTDLSSRFDIVDIEWPESMSGSETPASDGDASSSLISDAIPDDNAEPDIHLDVDTDDVSVSEPTTTSDATDANKVEEPNLEVDATSNDNDNDDATTTDDENIASDEDDVTIDDEKVDDESDEELVHPSKKDKKRKPKETTEENMKTYGELFKDKLLSEAKKVKKEEEEKSQEDKEVVAARNKMSAQVDALLDSFPTKQAKAIITLMLALGAPVKSMKMRKSELRTSIDGVAERYIKDSSFKIWVNKLLTLLSNGTQVKESFDDRLSNRWQHIVYRVLKALGLPDSVETQGQRALLTGIRDVAKRAIEDNKVRVNLTALADALGVDQQSINSNDELELPKLKEDVINEEFQDPLDSIEPFLLALGFDVTKNQSIEKQAKLGARQTLLSFSKHPQLLKKLGIITDSINETIKKK